MGDAPIHHLGLFPSSSPTCPRPPPRHPLPAVPWLRRHQAVGGSSAINGMIWVGGHPEDYNHWAGLTGDERWGYPVMREYFMRCETAPGGGAGTAESTSVDRGHAGPMHISHNRWTHPLSHAFVEAAG